MPSAIEAAANAKQQRVSDEALLLQPARDLRLETRLSADTSAAAFDDLADSGTAPSQKAIRDEECEQVQAILGRLEGPDRMILELRYIARLSLVEIADQLGIGSSAVKMRHLRALKRFRTLLEETDEESAS